MLTSTRTPRPSRFQRSKSRSKAKGISHGKELAVLPDGELFLRRTLRSLFPANYKLRYPLPVTCYPLPVTRYLLPVTCYPLPVTRYPLPVSAAGRWSLVAGRWKQATQFVVGREQVTQFALVVSCNIASSYIALAPGPGGRKPANSVRTPKVAAACGVYRCSVRPGVSSLPNVARTRP